MSLEILIATPAPPGSQKGNRITAERWARLLTELGHRVTVAGEYSGQECDLLIALHARRSATSIKRFHTQHPGRPLVVVLTGTDLHRDIHSDNTAKASLEMATALVVLHDRGAEELPDHLRGRVRTIHQSVVVPPGERSLPEDEFRASVLGHLRPEKDPFLAAKAARLLPASSRCHVVHLGAAMNEESAERAREESSANPRYEWRGELPQAEALDVLRNSHLHVLTSKLEGGANALCEAIACGVPTLSSHIPGSVGILGADYPGYFPVSDAEGLAALMNRAETEPAFYESLCVSTSARGSLVQPQRERDKLAELVIDLTR